MKVLVCGGRGFADRAAVFRALDGLHAKHGIRRIIHGAATGADALASEWARERGVPQIGYPAAWEQGRKAGPLRNQHMLDSQEPDCVIAFPGGSGTADMVRRAEAAGVRVWKPVFPQP